jgi:16S rRNA (cytosine1402-N4)-methyltransferase
MSDQDQGETYPHLPVLYQQIILAIRPKSSGLYVDGTIGAGGHASKILEESQPAGHLLGLDVDPQALAIARQRLSVFKDRVMLVQASYITMAEQMAAIGWTAVDGIILDLGVSSMQVDSPERGFSFQADGPLDMRFDPRNTIKAEDLVNHMAEEELSQVIWQYGEDRHARRIAQAIIRARPLSTTRQLADVITRVNRSYRQGRKTGGHIHPATRTFQALRIAVNQELDALKAVLPQAITALAPEGRVAILSFHSLEDRLVKQFFQRESQDCICPPEQPVCTCQHKASIRIITRHPVVATEAEIQQNGRARSAKLRVAEKLIG